MRVNRGRSCVVELNRKKADASVGLPLVATGATRLSVPRNGGGNECTPLSTVSHIGAQYGVNIWQYALKFQSIFLPSRHPGAGSRPGIARGSFTQLSRSVARQTSKETGIGQSDLPTLSVVCQVEAEISSGRRKQLRERPRLSSGCE